MRIEASSSEAKNVMSFVAKLQKDFVKVLESISKEQNNTVTFQPIEWLRDNGLHGGGIRYQAPEGGIFNRASVNVSQVQYDDLPEKPISSATALSTIIHPVHPLAPSIHIHISLTVFKGKKGVWRLMADLNPSAPDESDKEKFESDIKNITSPHYDDAKKAGDKYFYIPALQRHRGVSHYYMEGFSPETEDDHKLPQLFGETVIKTYTDILRTKLKNLPSPTTKQLSDQLDYHTLYFFQVLTLDRGTTAGLLIHNQNDVGTLGSLPSHINRKLLESWVEKTPAPRDQLISRYLNVLPKTDACFVSDVIKERIVKELREHYKEFPLV